MRSFTMSIYSGDVVSKDVLKSFRNLLQGGDGTSTKKLDEDLDILWASKGGNVDLFKWSKDDFITSLIPNTGFFVPSLFVPPIFVPPRTCSYHIVYMFVPHKHTFEITQISSI